MAQTSVPQDLVDAPEVSGLQVIVRQQTPFLPKVAFTLISLASLAGVTFTGSMAGMTPVGIGGKWLSLWAVGLAGGFAIWRSVYLHRSDPDSAQGPVDALNATAYGHARTIGRWVALVALLGAAGPLLTGYLDGMPGVRTALIVCMLVLAALLAVGMDKNAVSWAVAAVSLAAILLWAYADAGMDWQGLVRAIHLTAFSLWLGGALWNITVAMPTGRAHPNIDAVFAGAHQLDRFRWVVRFALPTIILTGILMASAYADLPITWWLTFPGALIPFKVLAIIGLVVVFITCPLFRHCSPVQGVCNLDDLDKQSKQASK